MKKNLLILILFSCNFITEAAVHNVPAQYATIQAALNACAANDTVLVQPGTYYENINWTGINGIKLFSAGDSSNTIIDGNQNGSVISFVPSAIDTNTVIRGFTITGGFEIGSAADGGGLFINQSSPKFEDVSVNNNHISASNWGYGAGVNCYNSNVIFVNCSISHNHTDSASWGYGGGIYMSGPGNPQFRNVKIENNRVQSNSWNYGAGVYCSGSNPAFENSIVAGNTAGDSALWCYGTGIYLENCTASLTNVMVSGNISGKAATWYYGTGIFCQDCSADMTNVLISGNMMSDGGFYYYGNGISTYVSSGQVNLSLMNVTIADNIRSNNGTVTGSGIYADAGSVINMVNSVSWNNNPGGEVSSAGATVTVSNSDVRGGFIGTGNILTDPLFVSTGDYHLTQNSPCINAGTLTGAPVFDLENNPRPMPAGTNPDLGCYEFNQTNVSVDENIADENYFSVYPNPATSLIVISYPLMVKSKREIIISDAAGKTVYQTTLPTADSKRSVQLNVSFLKSGFYFVKAITEKKELVQKLIVQ